MLKQGELKHLDDGDKEFRQKLINPMKKTMVNGNIDRYWLEPGCEPRHIGGTMSPIIHIAVENSTDRKQFIVFLQTIYEEQGDAATFKKIINAKNTQGQTTLDYIQYVDLKKRFIKAEEKGLNEFVRYLCDNGGTYAVYDKKCPVEYLTL